MQFLYEEAGEIKFASLLGAQPAHQEAFQVETPFGKRFKLKLKDVWYSFEQNDLQSLFPLAVEQAKTVDMDLLWECSPEQEFKFDAIAKEYFGDQVSPAQLIALAMALQAAPIYFRRKGRGSFQRAPKEQLDAALLAVERKKNEALIQQQLEDQLLEGRLPEAISGMTPQLLFAPDKNGLHYKALNSASQKAGLSIPALLLKVGALASPLGIHQGAFLKEHFPKGVGFDTSWATSVKSVDIEALPLAKVSAFSIDDAMTTEIDDAFSVTEISNGYFRVGVHIAAPALGVSRGDALDTIARKRLSTVYFPGGKITMLPEEFVEKYSLLASRSGNSPSTCPALSLYVVVNPEGEISDLPEHAPQTRVERVPIHTNLRLHEIEEKVTEETLFDLSNAANVPFQRELAMLWKTSKRMHAQRQKRRVEYGQKPEVLGELDPKALVKDFQFTVTFEGQPLAALQKSTDDRPDPFSLQVDDRAWQVKIHPRQRGSVIDLIVAEWMIFTNSTWGEMLASHQIPAIYRAQQGWGAQRTRMQTSPCRHEGLGVENYAWCTSPLRRYADLVNQWQLIAMAQHGVMAKLAAPFAPKDGDLLAIVADFDATYSAYGEFQNILEKYWCLRWVQQHALPYRTKGRTLKEGQVRLELVPLRLFIPELSQKERGLEVDLEILEVDLLSLTASVRVIDVQETVSPESFSIKEVAEGSTDLDPLDAE